MMHNEIRKKARITLPSVLCVEAMFESCFDPTPFDCDALFDLYFLCYQEGIPVAVLLCQIYHHRFCERLLSIVTMRECFDDNNMDDKSFDANNNNEMS